MPPKSYPICCLKSHLCDHSADYAGIWFEADVITDDLVGGGVFEPPQGVTLQLSDASQELSASFAIPQGNRRGEQTNRASVFLPFSSFVRSIYPRQGPCGNCRLDTSRILEVSVYILFQPGPFSITIRTIKAVQSKDADIPVATPVIPAIQMDDARVKSFIDTTIERGSVAYNKGNSDVCSAVYDCTMRTIDAASGPSKAVKAVASAAIQKAAPYDWNANDAPAWIYRRGFDTILNAYKGLSPPPEDAYPPVAAGDWAVTAISTAQVPKVPPRCLCAYFLPPLPSDGHARLSSAAIQALTFGHDPTVVDRSMTRILTHRKPWASTTEIRPVTPVLLHAWNGRQSRIAVAGVAGSRFPPREAALCFSRCCLCPRGYVSVCAEAKEGQSCEEEEGEVERKQVKGAYLRGCGKASSEAPACLATALRTREPDKGLSHAFDSAAYDRIAPHPPSTNRRRMARLATALATSRWRVEHVS